MQTRTPRQTRTQRCAVRLIARLLLPTLLLGIAQLSGCMNLSPNYLRPALPVAQMYAPELLPSGASNTPTAADIEWQRFFADPRLKRLIELSLTHNRDLRVAVLTIDQARAVYQDRKSVV